MNNELLIYAGIALMAVIIVVSLVKKAVKLAFTIIALLIVFSLARIFIYGVSPIDEFNAYKTNIEYGRDIATYTSKIKTSTDIIKDIVESKKYDEASVQLLEKENEKLHTYQSEVIILEHTEKLDSFHKNYCSYLNTIVIASDSIQKVASTGSGSMQSAEDIMNKLKTGLDNLTSITENR